MFLNVSLTASSRAGEQEDTEQRGLPAQRPWLPPSWGCPTAATATDLPIS